MRATKVDRLAAEVIAEAGITAPPVAVDALAVQHGARIVPEALDNEVSGVLYRHDDRVVIAVNERHAETRQRFTIAHELGHLLLHAGRPLIVDHVVRARINMRDGRSSLATEREEIEANRFAANLLMPADFIHAEITETLENRRSERRTIDALADLFNVSSQAMEFRLMNLGLRSAV